jgi:hypothetical protein
MNKIVEGLKDAIAGNFASVTIDGQTWDRRDLRWHKIADDTPTNCALLLFCGPAGPYVVGHFNTHLNAWVDNNHRQIVPTDWRWLPPTPTGFDWWEYEKATHKPAAQPLSSGKQT